jgi:hypothetical protein
MEDWLTRNWFDVLSAIGIVGGLLFTAVSLHSETKTRRIGNLLSLTQNHRQLWTALFPNPELKRVLDAAADLTKVPVTVNEEIFVNCVIQHLNSAHYALADKLVVNPEGLRQDVTWFFSLPIPRAVWKRVKVLQNDDFVHFVESCLTKPAAG